ncbi:MAG TPA: hypothetical protein VMV39_08375 [Terracidiphilus sp.]|nr:hypothetical protein [Terracidiphilus sp.]
MSSMLSKTKLGSQPGGRPPVAVELAPEGVLAAALPGGSHSPVYAFESLRAGVLMPGIGEQNLRSPEAVAEAIRKALGEVSPRTHAVTLILPDAAARVFVLDFDSFPVKAQEAVPVLRMRLRKMVPFDVEHAGISYQVLPEDKKQTRVLAAVLPGAILAEYESAVRTAGYEPGAVLPSSLAALAAVDSQEPVLAACLNGTALTTSITHGSDLLLFRTLDLPEDPDQRLAEVQRGIAVAAAYFEDKLAARPRQIYYSGSGTATEFSRWINAPEFDVSELVPHSDIGATTSLGHMSLAGLVGALAGGA